MLGIATLIASIAQWKEEWKKKKKRDLQNKAVQKETPFAPPCPRKMMTNTKTINSIQ